MWAQGVMYATGLPRNRSAFLDGSFGPLPPLQPMAIDQPDDESGRPEPRRMQYPVGWNMPVGVPGTEGLKLVSFQQLRQYADTYSIVRACIQLRKEEILGLDWDIMPTDAAQKQMRGSSEMHQDFQDRRKKILNFWKRPDPNYHDFQGWLTAVLEDLFVVDALSLYIHPPRIENKGLLGSNIAALEVIDGTTVRPLLDMRGGVPRPPNPAYQQYLWGVPRSDLMDIILEADLQDMDGDPTQEYRGDQLLYLPYTRRTWTPYGFPGLERAILPVVTGLRRQMYQLEWFTEGSIPGQFVTPGPDVSTPQQIKLLQDTLNALAGDQAWKHKIIVLPPGSKTEPQKPVQVADGFDEILFTEILMAYEVMPMELGILPKVSSTQGTGPANQMAKASQSITERKATKPLLRWLKTAIFDHILQDVVGQDDMQWVWRDLEEGDDAEAKSAELTSLIGIGLMSVDEGRVELGRTPWGLPLTSDPIYVGAQGIYPLGTIPSQVADADLGEQPITSEIPPSMPGAGGAGAPQAATTPVLPPPPPPTPPKGGGSGPGASPTAPAPRAQQGVAGGSRTPTSEQGGSGGSGTAAKAAYDELDKLRRAMKRRPTAIEQWEPIAISPGVVKAIEAVLLAGGTPDEAIAKGRQSVRASARLMRRDQALGEIGNAVASQLGELARSVKDHNSGPVGFIDKGTQVLQAGYLAALRAGAADARSDFSVEKFKLPVHKPGKKHPKKVTPATAGSLAPTNLTTATEAPLPQDNFGAEPADFQSIASDRANNQTGFLTGFAKTVLAGAAVDAVANRINLYSSTLTPAYEQGYGLAVDNILGGGDDGHGGYAIKWATSGDGDVCDLCADHEASGPYTMDNLPGWPGDGSFGDLCDGAMNCRCVLEYVDSHGNVVDTGENTGRDDANSFYNQRAAQEDAFDQYAQAVRDNQYDVVSQDSADRMSVRDAVLGTPGTRDAAVADIERVDLNLAAEPDLMKKGVKAAGLCVKAADTGRVLMVQRSVDNHNEAAAGKWEWPGGRLNKGEAPLDAAKREWEQETGVDLPDGDIDDNWTANDGRYQCFVYVIKHEADVKLKKPKNGEVENVAWWDPADLPGNSAVRLEVATSDWALIARADKLHKSGNAQALIDWYNDGADGAISWGSPGDFEACVRIAGKHISDPEGFCNLRHQDATGAPPGHAPGEKSDKVAKDATTPQSCVASELMALEAALEADADGRFNDALAFGNAAVAMSDILKTLVDGEELDARNRLDDLLDEINGIWAKGEPLTAPVKDNVEAAMANIKSVIGAKVNDQVTATSKVYKLLDAQVARQLEVGDVLRDDSPIDVVLEPPDGEWVAEFSGSDDTMPPGSYRVVEITEGVIRLELE